MTTATINHTKFVKTTNPCKSNKADSTDGDYLKGLYDTSKNFTYKYSNDGKYDGINKKETEQDDLVVGHLEYFKDGNIHVGNAYIKLSDIETPLKPISASTDGVNLTVVPAMDGDPAETKTGASLINGYNALAKVCLLKTTEELPLEGGTLPIGTSYQWVHPGGWVYKTEGGKYYYTGLTVDGWGATDEELKKSAVDIKNDPSSSASLSLKGGKRRRKTKRKRTKRRKTKRKRSRRKRTMKRRGKTRRRR